MTANWTKLFSILGIIATIIGIIVFVTGKQSVKDFLPNEKIKNIEGKWDMIFSYKDCENPELAFSDIELYYDLQIKQNNDKITAVGIKKSEKKLGQKPLFYAESGRANFRIDGEIKNGHLIGKTYELNSKNEELRGFIDVNVVEGHFIYDGKYKGGSKNDCDGTIKLKQKK